MFIFNEMLLLLFQDEDKDNKSTAMNHICLSRIFHVMGEDTVDDVNFHIDAAARLNYLPALYEQWLRKQVRSHICITQSLKQASKQASKQ